MRYLTLAIPASLADIAARIGKAMDPDTGGDLNFGVRAVGIPAGLDHEGNPLPQIATVDAEHLVAGFQCSDEFHASVQVWSSNAGILHAVLSSKYSERFPDLTPPTLAECGQFVGSALIDLDAHGILAGMAALCLAMAPPEIDPMGESLP